MSRGAGNAPCGMRRVAAARVRGFTLIEVLVALLIVALGMSALLETLSSSADNIGALRDKTAAEWIAMNLIAETRLALAAPAIGTLEGDVLDCANGDWHYQRQIVAVSQIPGLLSITVSVRRTGNASASDSASGSDAAAASGPAAGSLGTVGALGSINATDRIGCIDSVTPGSSLGASGSPGPSGTPGSLGASGSIGASGSLGPTGTLGPGATGGSASDALPPQSVGGTAANGGTLLTPLIGGSGGSSSGQQQSWLVTLAGFRGNAVAAANGENPDWTGTAFPNTAGPNGIPANTNGGTVQSPNITGTSGSTGTLGGTGSGSTATP